MPKPIFSRALLALAVAVAIAGPARADCGQDIEALQARLAQAQNLPDAKRDAVQRLLDQARERDSSGKKKGCQLMLGKAKSRLDSAESFSKMQ